MEHFTIGTTEVVLNLAKNPEGSNQNISAVMEDKRDKDIIIVINDNAQDGTDISWLWDVDFDRFADPLNLFDHGQRHPLPGYAAAHEVCGYSMSAGK